MTNPSIAMCFFMTILPQSCQYGGYSAHSIRARNFYLFTQIAQLVIWIFFNLSAWWPSSTFFTSSTQEKPSPISRSISEWDSLYDTPLFRILSKLGTQLLHGFLSAYSSRRYYFYFVAAAERVGWPISKGVFTGNRNVTHDEFRNFEKVCELTQSDLPGSNRRPQDMMFPITVLRYFQLS